MEINFVVYGNPKALKRHRTYTKGKGGRALPFPMQVDPSKNDKADFLAMALQNKPKVPFECPLRVRMIFWFDRPKSHYRTGKNSHELKENAPVCHTSAPDCDNLAKFVCDALNGIFWKDDRIICEMIIGKYYTNIPQTSISITTL
jgi:Holliday junction resolvase RusA-like endonuclease